VKFLDYLDDVWHLPPLPAAEVLDHPVDWPGRASGYRWITTPVARTWHDCTDPACRAIIGAGDPYYREAVPEGGRVTVFKFCASCAPDPR
jgi:hypothetical protein